MPVAAAVPWRRSRTRCWWGPPAPFAAWFALAAVELHAATTRVAVTRGATIAVATVGSGRERLRIARDVHDLVGHGLVTVAVRSSTAPLVLDAGDVTSPRSGARSSPWRTPAAPR